MIFYENEESKMAERTRCWSRSERGSQCIHNAGHDGRCHAVGESWERPVDLRQELLDYAWLGTREEQEREIECILAQDSWRYLDAKAEQYAAAQPTPLEDYSEATEFAISALYECHGGPHLDTCPSVTGRSKPVLDTGTSSKDS